jgi:hypothetical protein
MKMNVLLSALLFGTVTVQAADVVDAQQQQAVQQVVFAGTHGVPDAMQQAIAAQLVQKHWQTKDGKLATERCGVAAHKTDVLDLNADGKAEVMLLLGNACTSGKIGSTIYLFTPEADGKVQRQLGFSTTGYQIQKRDGTPWADLLFTGTGDCQPIWTNQNGRYNFERLVEAKAGACSVPAPGHGQ